MSIFSRAKQAGKAAISMERKTTEKYTYTKGDTKLDFGLTGLRQHKDFLPLLERAVEDVKAKIEELKAEANA